jgi:phosphoribosylglycinamide formyltransferase 1
MKAAGSVPNVSQIDAPSASPPTDLRLAVLASGSGTILESILAAELPVVLVAADRWCRALEVAARARVEGVLVDRTEFGGFGPTFDRQGYTQSLTDVLVDARVDVVAMAGFGTVLGAAIHGAFPERILNTHPALLPAFPGWHAVADALAAGVKETGTTVHLATLEMDTGPVLASARVAIEPGDTEATLHERIKAVERTLYPETIRTFLAGLATGVVDGRGSRREVGG